MAAVGLAMGILCIVAGLLWYWHRRRQKSARNEQTAEDMSERPGMIGALSLMYVESLEWDVTNTYHSRALYQPD